MRYLNIPRAVVAYLIALIALVFYLVSYGLAWLADIIIPSNYTLITTLHTPNGVSSNEESVENETSD